jgi:hypothetical protein
MSQKPPVMAVVGENVDTFIGVVSGEIPAALGNELDRLKAASQETEEDVATPFAFCGETLYIKPHGSQRHWRWILHSPSLHLEMGRGKYNHVIARTRLGSAFLWEHGFDVALMLLYAFVHDLVGQDFALNVSEVHACADVAGWGLTLADVERFVTRGHNSAPRVLGEEEDDAESGDQASQAPFATLPAVIPRLRGRRCVGYDFSRGAAHACCIYDKTAELAVSRKDWMRLVWEANGWDGVSRVMRIEFRYKRECLRELGVDDASAFLDRRQLPSLWAYSTKSWLRHTTPTKDVNRARWPISPVWEAVQRAEFYGDGVPGIRERKTAGDLKLICQMMAGCSSTAGALLTGTLPTWDDGANFLGWFYTWLGEYLEEKGMTFEAWCREKRRRLGVVMPTDNPAA